MKVLWGVLKVGLVSVSIISISGVPDNIARWGEILGLEEEMEGLTGWMTWAWGYWIVRATFASLCILAITHPQWVVYTRWGRKYFDMPMRMALNHISSGLTDGIYPDEGADRSRAFRAILKLAQKGRIKISGRKEEKDYGSVIRQGILKKLSPVNIAHPRVTETNPVWHLISVRDDLVYVDLRVKSEEIYKFWPKTLGI